MNISKKKLTAAAAGLAALTLVCVGASALTPSSDLIVSASTEETENSLKVFIGDVNHAAEDYVQQRDAYISEVAEIDADEVMEAVIGLDDYYAVEAVAELAEDYDTTINRVYMWPKGETGRLILFVEDNDIEASIEAYKQEVAEDGSCEEDEQFAKDFQRLLDGDYGVFALAVTASAEALEELSTTADCISYVDVKYNDEAETYARQAGKVVSYIELPSKPDRAL